MNELIYECIGCGEQVPEDVAIANDYNCPFCGDPLRELQGA